MRFDPDYNEENDDDNENGRINNLCLDVASSSIPMNPMFQPIYLVYEACLEKLMTHCPRCKQPILNIESKKTYGTQVCYQFSCLTGCDEKWQSQPVIAATKGTILAGL